MLLATSFFHFLKQIYRSRYKKVKSVTIDPNTKCTATISSHIWSQHFRNSKKTPGTLCLRGYMLSLISIEVLWSERHVHPSKRGQKTATRKSAEPSGKLVRSDSPTQHRADSKGQIAGNHTQDPAQITSLQISGMLLTDLII